MRWFEERVLGLGSFLAQWRHVWLPRPFVHERLQWEEAHPGLSSWLRALPVGRIAALERPRVPSLPQAPWSAAARALTRLPALRTVSLPDPPGLAHGVPERKWAQVRAFGGLAAARAGDRIVDWCAGKGHLGRTLAALTGRSAVALEWRPAVCAAGRILAERAAVTVPFECVDVQASSVWDHLRPQDTVAALHACGSLSDALFAGAHDGRVAALVAAPCCCHRIDGPTWRPRSRSGRAAFPHRLLSSDLRLATADEIGPATVGRTRRMAWYQGVDRLVRDARGGGGHIRLPRVGKTVRNGPFLAYAATVGERLGVALDLSDPARAERAGWERARIVRALDLVRCQFRRALELFVWLDRAAWLSEAGWEVEAGTFCARSVTPRNVAVCGIRPRRTRRGGPRAGPP